MKLYKHYKTKNWYRIWGYARHTETGERLVVYQRTDEKGTVKHEEPLWARPQEMFFGTIIINGDRKDRFELFSIYDDDCEAFHT